MSSQSLQKRITVEKKSLFRQLLAVKLLSSVSGIENRGNYLSDKLIIVLILSHLPFALAIQKVPLVATLHAIGVLIVLVYMAATGAPASRVVIGMSYMVGCEVLWRLGKADIFWEYAKYAASLIAIIGIVKAKGLSNCSKLPLVYFVCLLPSLFVLPRFDRSGISFNLSGPLCLCVCTLYFSSVKLNWGQVERVLIALLIPMIAAGFLAVLGIASLDQIEARGSIFAGSAGYGPNQMSSILGLGAMIACLHAMLFKSSLKNRYLMICIALWLAAQCTLTFSRGGFWTMLLGLAVSMGILFREKKYTRAILTGSTVVFLMMSFLIFPALEEFTKGSLSKRFESFNTTHRYEIVETDLNVFLENPLLGVGPGWSVYYHRILMGAGKKPHTEYSRLLAEHGIFGLTAIGILIVMAFQRAAVESSKEFKAVALALTVWALVFMLHSSMRLAASGFIFALGAIQLQTVGFAPKRLVKI